jgi:hypothetical protein
VGGEVAVGTYAGLGGYVLGSWAGNNVAGAMGATSDVTRDRVGLAAGVVAAGFATAGSVYGIGNAGDQTGSFSATMIGTGAGLTAGILLNQLMYGHTRLPADRESSRMRWLEASLEAFLPSIGATIAFNSSRRFK